MSIDLHHHFEQNGEEVSCIDRFLGDDLIANLSINLCDDKIKKRLTLRGNCIAEKGAHALADMLKKNITLEQLSLDWNLLGTAGTVKLARGLEVNVSLLQVDLRNNGVTDDGAVALAECLMNNSSIETLDLRWNQINDRGAEALYNMMEMHDRTISVNIHGNPVSPALMAKFDKMLLVRDESPITVTTPVAVFHPSHQHDNFIESLQRDNTQLRRQCSQSQTLASDYQRQLDVSALKIVEYEQEADRAKYRYESVTEELNSVKLRMSQMNDEHNAFKQNMLRERHELTDKMRNAAKQQEQERSSHHADIQSLEGKLKMAEDSNKVLEDMLEHTREKHKADVEDLEKRWREEQQRAYDFNQQCKDAKQEALDLRDDLVTAKQLAVHYESMMKGYDKRIDDTNALHSQQLHTLMENHRKEMADFGEQSTVQSKVIAQLQAKLATVESSLAKMEIDKLHEIDSAVATERGICNERYSSQITELKSRVEAYLLTKTVMEEKYGELAKELASVRAEGEKFAAEMKSSRQSLLDENTKLKNTNSDLKTGAMTAKGDLAHLQAQIDEYKQTVEDIKIEKKEVYASLQDSVTDRQRLLELTEKLKHKLDSLNASRVDDFERVERSVLNTVEKEFETLKIQLKITGGKSNGKDKVLLSASSSAANLHSY